MAVRTELGRLIRGEAVNPRLNSRICHYLPIFEKEGVQTKTAAAIRGGRRGTFWPPESAIAETAYGKTISTRRFCGSRTPGAVGTRGSFMPRPVTTISLRGTPSPSRADATALARRSESRWL